MSNLIGLATDDDLLVVMADVPTSALRDILDIAFTQLDEADDDLIEAYGFTPEQRDELVAHIGHLTTALAGA